MYMFSILEYIDCIAVRSLAIWLFQPPVCFNKLNLLILNSAAVEKKLSMNPPPCLTEL